MAMKFINHLTFLAFVWPSCKAFHPSFNSKKKIPETCRFNFFKDVFDSAFETVDNAFQNDQNLSTVDKRKGMLEGPNSVDPDSAEELTEVQKIWRNQEQQPSSSTGGVNIVLLENTRWNLYLYLAGVPETDPSNNLYGSRVNISNRNKQLGIDLPKESNAQVEIEFLPDGLCLAYPSDLTSSEVEGQWKVSENGNELRFSMNVLGYSRTIQTKGSIEKIYWSEQPEVSRQTTSTYEIPPGWVYCDIKIENANQPGLLDLKGDGTLRIEKRTGLLGAGSKLVVCGKFSAKMNYDT
mmetsp:Transcript_18102/g.20872  ORF Transcript_18102/g.20872 Transcript_18102/m.20872 type:complete len:294 (-) Transcript_18102:209-1090(-)